MKCEITGCDNEADRIVCHCHQDKRLRWEAAMCGNHAKEVKPGTGELVYKPIEVKHG